jgi:YidC/Oxa1 family membrane protein insertase
MNEFLKSILDGIYNIVGNYGWSIVLFTLLIRIILSPFDYKSRKSMRKTQKLQPQISALQKKYKNDKEKLNQKMAELYRKERINPLSGCLPMLLSLPILFAMLGAMRLMADEQIAGHVFTYLSGGTPNFQGWLWVRNIWMPDSPFATMVPGIDSINTVTRENWQVWQTVFHSLSPDVLKALPSTINFDFATVEAAKTTVAAMIEHMKTLPAYTDMINTVPGWSNIQLLIVNLSVFQHFNGYFLLPILAAVTQFLMSSLMPQAQPTAQEGQPNTAGTANFMKWFFPVFSLFICYSANAGFSLYWVTANVIAAAQNVVLNKYFDAQEKKAAAAEGEGTVK